MSGSKHCPFCGSIVEPDAAFCANCGASITSSTEPSSTSKAYETESYPPPPPQDQTYQYGTSAYQQPTYTPEPKKDNTLGLVSLIFGILGCVGVLPCIGSIVAIITGFMGRDHPDDSMAKIGLGLGFVGCCLYVVGIVIWIVVVLVSIPFY